MMVSDDHFTGIEFAFSIPAVCHKRAFEACAEVKASDVRCQRLFG